MAILSLANYDILDLLMTSRYPEEKRGDYLLEFMRAYAGFLSEAVANILTDKDEEEMMKLLYSPGVTPEEIEQFYKERIPDYDAFLVTAALKFKKDYLLDFYKRMFEATRKQKDQSTPFWEEIVKQAETDNWERVSELAREIETKFLQHRICIC